MSCFIQTTQNYIYVEWIAIKSGDETKESCVSKHRSDSTGCDLCRNHIQHKYQTISSAVRSLNSVVSVCWRNTNCCWLPITWLEPGETSTRSLCFSLYLSLFCSLHTPRSLHHASLSLSVPPSFLSPPLVHPFKVTATGTGSPAAGNSRWFNLNLRKQDGNQM